MSNRERILEDALANLSNAAFSFKYHQDPISEAALDEAMREADELIIGGTDERSQEHFTRGPHLWAPSA